MTHGELPDDLDELEGLLIERQRLEPSAGFHARLLVAMRQELYEDDALPLVRSGWQFVAGVAAAVVLWANFSMSVANDMSWRFVVDWESHDTKALAAELRTFFPDMSEQEVSRQAFVVQEGSWLLARLDARGHDHFEQAMRERQANEWK